MWGISFYMHSLMLCMTAAPSVLQERVDAVEEIISSTSEKLVSLRDVLKNLPDLAKGLCRIQYGKVCCFMICGFA